MAEEEEDALTLEFAITEEEDSDAVGVWGLLDDAKGDDRPNRLRVDLRVGRPRRALLAGVCSSVRVDGDWGTAGDGGEGGLVIGRFPAVCGEEGAGAWSQCYKFQYTSPFEVGYDILCRCKEVGCPSWSHCG